MIIRVIDYNKEIKLILKKDLVTDQNSNIIKNICL